MSLTAATNTVEELINELYSDLFNHANFYLLTNLLLDDDLLNFKELNYNDSIHFSKMSLKRQKEFVAGRFCSNQALNKLGCNVQEVISINKDKSPNWPDGYIGSITHADDFVAAAAAKKTQLRGLGIDSEKIMTEEISQKIMSLIINDREYQFYKNQLSHYYSLQEFITVVFSAKESIYKCLFPLAGAFIDFNDIELNDISFNENILKFSLLKSIKKELVSGYKLYVKFKILNNYIHTAIELS